MKPRGGDRHPNGGRDPAVGPTATAVGARAPVANDFGGLADGGPARKPRLIRASAISFDAASARLMLATPRRSGDRRRTSSA